MIVIIVGKPRVGKTVLMTFLLCRNAFDYDRYVAMRNEIEQKNANGFNLTVPKTCVYTNYDCIFREYGRTPIKANKINPFRLGFANKYVNTHFIAPYGCIGITEGQKYFNSRMSMWYPDWQSRWFEQHGHNYLDIFIDTQKHTLIDSNIRELAGFIEVRKLDYIYDKNGDILGLKWVIRYFEDCASYEKYVASGRKDTSTYEERKITAHRNVFEMYDSRNCKPKFYDGHMGDDFDLNESQITEQSFDGFLKYLKESDDEYVDGFYQKRGVK